MHTIQYGCNHNKQFTGVVMAKGIKRNLQKVYKIVNSRISAFAKREGIYAGGLASEGYLGGYRDALDDVIVALNGTIPNRWLKSFNIKEEDD